MLKENTDKTPETWQGEISLKNKPHLKSIALIVGIVSVLTFVYIEFFTIDKDSVIEYLLANPKPETTTDAPATYKANTQILEIKDFRITSKSGEKKIGNVKFKMIPIKGKENTYKMVLAD